MCRPRKYLSDRWQTFDFIVVVISVVDYVRGIAPVDVAKAVFPLYLFACSSWPAHRAALCS